MLVAVKDYVSNSSTMVHAPLSRKSRVGVPTELLIKEGCMKDYSSPVANLYFSQRQPAQTKTSDVLFDEPIGLQPIALPLS